MGHWNGESYDSINYENIQWAIDNVKAIMSHWGSHEALYGLQPVNEPWGSSDLDVLKYYYRNTREEVRKVNPDALFVFHDAFISNSQTWNDVFADDDKENVVLDTHKYLAWNARLSDVNEYCDSYRQQFKDLEGIKYPLWVGEWSLATDVCAFWLLGFNDSNMDYQFDCEWVPCPASTNYLPASVAVDFNREAETLGPYGASDRATVHRGACARDSTWFSDEQVRQLGACMTDVFIEANVQGQFLWTAHNELETRWSYLLAFDKGWLQKGPIIKPKSDDEIVE